MRACWAGVAGTPTDSRSAAAAPARPSARCGVVAQRGQDRQALEDARDALLLADLAGQDQPLLVPAPGRGVVALLDRDVAEADQVADPVGRPGQRVQEARLQAVEGDPAAVAGTPVNSSNGAQ